MENTHLRSFIERIERLEEEKKGIADDIRDVYAEVESRDLALAQLEIAARVLSDAAKNMEQKKW